MDLNRVSAFVRVVTDGSFTAAAQSLGLPKSSISRSVSQLEQELGIRLLHRTTRQLHLTDAGAAFYERASRALTDIDEATTAAADAQADLSGVVRVTAPTDLGIWALAPIVRRFTRKHPGIRVELKLTGRVVDLVAEGIDLAVRAGPLRDSSLIARRVGDLESGAYASPRYLARRGTPATVADLAAHDCVLFRPVSGRSTWELTDANGSTESVDVTGPIASDDFSFVRASVMGGAGIALLPSFIIAGAQRAGRVRRVLEGWSQRTAPLHIAYPSSRFVPQRVVALREHLMRDLGLLVRRCAGEESKLREAHANGAAATAR